MTSRRIEVSAEGEPSLISSKQLVRSTKCPMFPALWLYDYIQTLPMEVEAIWLRRMTGSSVLFLANRYLIFTSIALSLFTGVMGGVISRERSLIVLMKPCYIYTDSFLLEF